jgi:hypothetical protein
VKDFLAFSVKVYASHLIKVIIEMLKAEQSALLQNANQQLIDIRSREVNYLTNNIQNYISYASILVMFSFISLDNNDVKKSTEKITSSYIFHFAGDPDIIFF